MSDDDKQYLRVPKENAEAMLAKLTDAGLLDKDAEVRLEGDFVSFQLVTKPHD